MDGYKVKYQSLKLLSEDHQSYLTHGGAVVPKSGKLPSVNTPVLLRIETPSGAYFDLPSRVVRELPEMGFVVAFEDAARPSKIALDELMSHPDFVRGIQAEGHLSGPKKRVVLFDPRAESAPPPPPEKDAIETLDGLLAPPEPRESAAPPKVGASFAIYVVKYTTLLDYLDHAKDFIAEGLLRLEWSGETEAPGSPCQLKLTLPAQPQFELYGVLEDVAGDSVSVRVNLEDPVFCQCAAFPRTLKGQKRLATEREDHRAPVSVLRLSGERSGADDENLPIRRRLQRMTMEEKMNLALCGEREERMALAQDGNKALHHYLLRNARISIDEIAFMARLPTLNPDVLLKIGENPAYTQNLQVVKNLVYNPKTPPTLSIRLLDRLPKSEIAIIAKRTSMQRSLVAAAQKKAR